MALTKVGQEGITGVSNSSDDTAITIDSSERVGIRATPLYPLHVNTSTNKNFMVRDSVAPTGGVMLQSVNDADSAATAMELRGSLFSFQVGRVGIGTSNPNTHQLEVHGGDWDTSLKMLLSTSSYLQLYQLSLIFFHVLYLHLYTDLFFYQTFVVFYLETLTFIISLSF